MVRDGLENNEETMIGKLERIAKRSDRVFQALLSKTWIADRTKRYFAWNEQNVVRNFSELAESDAEFAEQLVVMPFLETVEIPDEIAMRKIVWLFHNDRHALRHMLALPEFEEGITDELTVLIPLFYLETLDPEAAKAIRSLPWVSDGRPSKLDEHRDTEPTTIETLQRMAVIHPEVFWAVVESEWMRHTPRGFTPERESTVTYLGQIADVDEASALQIRAIAS